MQCGNCGHPNGDDASFCSSCGTRLALECPRCGSQYSPGDAFCSNCGHRLTGGEAGSETDPLLRYVPAELLEKLTVARTHRTMAGERRMVTMLFADIQGSTAAAERLDPEEWAEIINGAFERLIQPVYRYEGTLARLMGDGVLAFFGAPIAHEDDPERAVRAGLAMLQEIRPYAGDVGQRWGVAFDLRVGINTGLVVVGEVGSDLRVEYTAMGDAVNTAARMEQAAEPGTLLVSEHTQRRLARSLFDFEALDPIEVRGKSEPITAFRVVGTRDRPSPAPATTGRALVGRSEELARLRSVADAVRSGRGQIATIVGEAGVGKSRLVSALRADLEAAGCTIGWGPPAVDPDRLAWAEARCLSYDTAVAYAPFVDLFSRSFGIEPDEDEAIRRAQVAAAVEASGADDSGRLTTYLGVLLGIAPEGAESSIVAGLPTPALQRRVFAAVVDYLRACAARAPTLIVFEDLHWADSVSLALLEEILAATDRTTLGVIALMRPYRDDPSWRFLETAQRSFAHRHTSIHLPPLDAEAAATLLHELSGDALPHDLAAAVLHRADGNPFFVEEIVRNLMEAGASQSTAIPDTVSALLTARIDRLDGASKLAVQLASVVGREFEFGELSALVGDTEATEAALSNLLSRELIVERSRLPEREYSFRHALIQETAYSTILLKERQSLHAQVAEYLATRPHEPQEMARHLMGARREAEAVPYLLEAAGIAARSMNLTEAIRLYDQVLTWVPADDTATAIRAHEGLGAAYSLIPDLSAAAAAYQQMLEVGKERSEPSVQITALNRLGSTTAFLSGDVVRATEFLEQARSLAEEVGDEMGLAEYHMMSCMLATHLGDLDAAARHDAETARLGGAAGSDRVRIGGLVQRAQSLVFAGRFEEGREALGHARRAAAGTTDPDVELNLAGTEAILNLRDGDLAGAWATVRRSTDLASRIGSPTAGILNLYAGMVATELGSLEHALTHYAEAGRAGEELGQLFITAAASASMVRIYADMGIDGADVSDLREKAIGYAQQPAGRMLSSIVDNELGWAALARRDPSRAAESFRRAIDGTSAAKPLATVPLLLGMAVTRRESGALEEAGALVERAAAFVEDKGLAFGRPYVAMVNGAIAAAAGRPDEAVLLFGQGAGLAEGMGQADLVWRLRAARSGALGRLGRDEEAAAEAAAAHRAVDEVAARFADPGMRDAYLASARAQISHLTAVSAG